MDENEHPGFQATRRRVLESGTIAGASLLGGFPEITLSAKAVDADAAPNPNFGGYVIDHALPIGVFAAAL